MRALVQCMGGGWCRSRDKCAHYYAPRMVGLEPVERLCGKVEEPEPFRPGKGEADREVMRAHAEDIAASHAAGLIVDPLVLEWAHAVLVTTSRQWGDMGAGDAV